MNDVRRALRRRILSLIAASLALAVAVPAPAFATVAETSDFAVKVQGIVYAVTQVDDRTIVAGDFDQIGSQPRRNVGKMLRSGYVDRSFVADTDGLVYAAATSADGSTVFLGGTFTEVNGVPRANLAAVDASTGTVLSDWVSDTNDEVRALAVHADRLYVGGAFTGIDRTGRRRLAAVDTSTGDVDKSFAPLPNWTVRGITVSPDGSRVYAVGGFETIGGQDRPEGVAELLAADGSATGFSPSTGGGTPIAVTVSPDGGRLYFSTIYNWVFAYDPAISDDPVWSTRSSGDVQAMAATSDELYVGGHFRRFLSEDIRRNRLASLRVADGTVTDWNPDIGGNMGPWSLALTPDQLVVGGDFVRAGDDQRSGLARFTGGP